MFYKINLFAIPIFSNIKLIWYKSVDFNCREREKAKMIISKFLLFEIIQDNLIELAIGLLSISFFLIFQNFIN
jgi:hypothetical protein